MSESLTAVVAPKSIRAPRPRFLRRLWHESPASAIGLGVVGVFLFIAIFGPWLAPYSPTAFGQEVLVGPSRAHWLGTDQFGRDQLSRILVGSRNLAIPIIATAVSVVVGTVVGLEVGYRGGALDSIVSRLSDGLMSFPAVFLALLIRTMLGGSSVNIVIAIAVVFAPRVARVVRSAVLEYRQLPFVAAAQSRGESSVYIVYREIFPNVLGPVVVEASIRLSYAILLTSTLGFIGLGVPPPTPDWGRMVFEGQAFMSNAPWLIIAPSVAISILVIATNVVADGLSRLAGSTRPVVAS